MPNKPFIEQEIANPLHLEEIIYWWVYKIDTTIHRRLLLGINVHTTSLYSVIYISIPI